MAAHRFKSGYALCRCSWCARRRHQLPECQIDDAMRLALRDWAKAHGRTWKLQLSQAWATGEGITPELQRVRNILGPRRLMQLDTSMVLAVADPQPTQGDTSNAT